MKIAKEVENQGISNPVGQKEESQNENNRSKMMTQTSKKMERREWKKSVMEKVEAVRRSWGPAEVAKRAKMGEMRREHLERLLFSNHR